jgi:hypothetical protein
MANEKSQNCKKAIKFYNNLDIFLFRNPWMFIPPVPTENVFNALTVFYLPLSVLSKQI